MNKNKLNPACVFEQFAKINTIPRPSKREEKMISFLKEFGESRGLETIVDETGNVLIRKNNRHDWIRTRKIRIRRRIFHVG